MSWSVIGVLYNIYEDVLFDSSRACSTVSEGAEVGSRRGLEDF